MAENVQFYSDMADEGHIGKAIGFYEADKGVVHLYAPVAGHRSVAAADIDHAESIFWAFVTEVNGPT